MVAVKCVGWPSNVGLSLTAVNTANGCDVCAIVDPYFNAVFSPQKHIYITIII